MRYRLGARTRRRLLQTTLSAGGLLAVALLAAAAWIAWPLPARVASPGPVPSLELRDRHGLLLRTTRSDEGARGGWMPLAALDPEIIQAFLAAEDHRFFQHHGVDGRAVLRALRDNVKGGYVVSGASTLTMQTARLLRPIGRGWTGKLRQTLWALRLEAHLDKSRILETYLNRVPLGQGAVGVAAAARLYFGAQASDVSLGQAAMLAGLAHLPSRENPLVSPDHARARRDLVLDRMRALGYATPADAQRARHEPVLSPGNTNRFAAPHFTTQLLQRAGSATGTLHTTLDLDLQQAIEAEVRHTVATLHDRSARQAAAVVLDNRSGDILAWVGSPDFFADTAGQVDMVISRRQPGSALKPFLYGLAFDRGWTPASVLPDVPHTWSTTTGPYRPQNYDRRFRGPVRARVALASSFNVPAVWLADQLGAPALLATLRTAGFASLDRSADTYGLGLALGNGEVTLLELANGYRGIAGGGVWRPVRWLTDAALPAGRGASADIAVSTPRATPGMAQPRRFMSGGAAALVLDILQDPVARIPGFGVETPLDYAFPAASKTGTSRHFTDNWAVTTTANFTVAVWVGNFSGSPMQGVSGISGAGPLLYRAVLQVARRYAPGALPTPAAVGAEAEPVCALSGLRATPGCASLVEWFLPGTPPTRSDDWQRAGRTTLPPEYAEWLSLEDADHPSSPVLRNGAAAAGEPANIAVSSTRGYATQPESRTLPDVRRRIVSPQDGDVYEVPVGVRPEFATLPLAALPADGVRWRIDGRPFMGARWPIAEGRHEVSAEWPDGARDSVRINVRPAAAPVPSGTR